MGMMDLIKNLFKSPEIKSTNPQGEAFVNLNDNESAILSKSVLINDIYNKQTVGDKSQYEMINEYKAIVYSTISGNKINRINSYRMMTQMPEVASAINEYTESFLTENDHGSYCDLKFSNIGKERLSADAKEILRKEAMYIYSLFELENNVDSIRTFLLEGEFCAENLISSDRDEQLKYGILGINKIANESYEIIVDKSGAVLGIVTNIVSCDQNDDSKAFTSNLSRSLQSNIGIQGYYTMRPGANNFIIMPINQITYSNSGLLNNTKNIIYPILEKARASYKKLSLIEDAAIIYRLVRAPERLVFNVAVGELPPHKQEQALLNVMRRNNVKKVVDPSNGNISNNYDPHSMLENFYFAKDSNGIGTEVTTIGGNGQAFGELEDLKYFQKKLYASLEIPFNRFLADQSEIKIDGETLTHDEFRFARAVIRQQQQFISGVKKTLITHLKMKGLWDSLKLTSHYFNYVMNPPIMYDLYLKQKTISIKTDMYNNLASAESISKTLLQEDILEWSSEKIDRNNELIEEEIIRKAILDRKVANVGTNGTMFSADELDNIDSMSEDTKK